MSLTASPKKESPSSLQGGGFKSRDKRVEEDVEGRNEEKGKGNPAVPFLLVLAESEGFKPPIPEKGIPDFESSAIDHSANSPSK